MSNDLFLRIFDVEHGACTIMAAPSGRIAMIDCGHNETTGFRPSAFIRYEMDRQVLDYLMVTNADQDHLSDLYGLWVHQVNVRTLMRNPTPAALVLRRIKEAVCVDLTDDIERFLTIHETYNAPVQVPFNAGMGGVTVRQFYNRYPAFDDTNNLSCAFFITYCGFTILFPGDLEEAGWKTLLADPAFVEALRDTTILVASHHGRRSGFCAEIFDHFTPKAVVISDKSIEFDTQDVDYSCVVDARGVIVTNQTRNRHVLTTRRDGDILFKIDTSGNFSITTYPHVYRRAA